MVDSITLLLALAEADLRLVKQSLAPLDGEQAAVRAEKVDPNLLIRQAELEWERVAYLAARLSDPTLRSENLFRLVDAESFGARAIAIDFSDDGLAPQGSDDLNASAAVADRILRSAERHAGTIERSVWQDRALAEAATNAAGGQRFDVALEIVRKVKRPEARTDALIRIAGAQAKHSEFHENARATYDEAAKSVALITQADPRAVLTAALIESLIQVGFYADARSKIVLYSDRENRLKALASVAFSQGRHGDEAAAKEWIARDIPEQFRPFLNRKVDEGVIEASEENRARAISPHR
jgi:hypothetical protein